MLDYAKTGHLSKKEISKHWTGPYRNTYTDILFREMDLNSDGLISRSEWKAYWKLLRNVGYSRKEVLTCVIQQLN